MTNRKNTTRARLAASALAMLLCVALLVGTTFAWFSDEAKTGDTTITAGNLDVELYVGEEKATTDTSVFKDPPELWEPGVMMVSEQIQVKNEGSLWLEYALTLVAEETPAPNGKLLSDVIKAKITTADNSTITELQGKKPNATQQERQDAWEAIDDEAVDLASFTESGALAPKDVIEGEYKDSSDPQVIVLYWEPNLSTDLGNPDNDYNIPAGETAPSINFTLNVLATQYEHESDSFGSKYDEGAMVQVASADELKKALSDPSVSVVELSGDIEVPTDAEPLRVTSGKTLDGQGHTLSRAEGDTSSKSTLVIGDKEASGSSEPIVVENLTVKGTAKSGEPLANNRFAVYVNPNTNVEFDNVDVDATENAGYALDVTEGAQVTVKGGSLSGYGAVVFGTSYTDAAKITSKLTLTNVHLKGIASDGGTGNSFGVITIYNPTKLDEGAITLTGCTVETTSEESGQGSATNAFESHILLQNKEWTNAQKDEARAALEKIIGTIENVEGENTFLVAGGKTSEQGLLWNY